MRVRFDDMDKLYLKSVAARSVVAACEQVQQTPKQDKGKKLKTQGFDEMEKVCPKCVAAPSAAAADKDERLERKYSTTGTASSR